MSFFVAISWRLLHWDAGGGGSCQGGGRDTNFDVPKVVGAIVGTREDSGVAEEYSNGFSVEYYAVAVVTKLRYGDKGTLQSQEDVGNARRMRKSGAWKKTTVRSLKKSSVWLRNS